MIKNKLFFCRKRLKKIKCNNQAQMSDALQSISFAEIVRDRDATVRVTSDGLLYAVDLVLVVTGKDRNQAGEVLRRISDEIFPSSKMLERSLPGKGMAKTRLLTFKDSIELVMVLPGAIAKETRTQFANILTRYMAGDASLHEEIQSNAESNSPIAQMARASLETSDPSSLERKRKREELEILELEQNIRAKMHDNMTKIMGSYQSACTDTIMDERARLMFKDYFLNLTVQAGGSAITNGEADNNKPISLSTVALDLGYRLTSNQAKSVGARLKTRYVEKHGKAPPKHEQLCDGRVTRVNSYTEKDRSLVEEVLHDYMDEI